MAIKKFFTASKRIFKKLIHLVSTGPFISITVVGNTIVFLFSLCFYHLEHQVNEKVGHFIDALWWSFATATTVGYGDITPVSYGGKILGIFLMLTGTALFATYTALFAQAILGDDVSKIKQIDAREIGQMDKLVQIKDALYKIEKQLKEKD